MLTKMGWNKEKGLGAKEDGQKEFITLRYKNDSGGMGFQERDNQWTENETQFDSLLKSLNQTEEGEAERKTESLEAKSKGSRARVHYKKFTRGKDTSRYSAKDLANIFGKKTLEEGEGEEEKEAMVTGKDEDGVVPLKHGVETYQAPQSSYDYFKKKLGKFFGKKDEGEEMEVEEKPEIETSPVESDGPEKKEKKKNKKRKLEEEEEEEKVDQKPEPIEEPAKKKKKKKKQNEPEAVELVESDSNNQEEQETSKKATKKSKKTKASDKEPVIIEILDNSIQEGNDNVDQVIDLNESDVKEEEVVPVAPKKTKKNKKDKTKASVISEEEVVIEVASDDENKDTKKKSKKRKDTTKTISLLDDEDEDVVVETKKQKKKKSKNEM